MTGISAFERWWLAHPLRNERIDADDVMAAWDAAIAAEREACAEVAEKMDLPEDWPSGIFCLEIASAIRARGKP